MIKHSRADLSFNVTVDTSGLAGDASLTVPFGVDFQLLQGDTLVLQRKMLLPSRKSVTILRARS